MTKAFAVAALAIAVLLPAGARSATGMDAMQYYVGTWSCLAGDVGQTPSKATATYSLDNGVLRGWVVVPPTGKMKTAYAFSADIAYDSKNGRYVQTSVDNMNASWDVQYAKPWTGNTELWADHVNGYGKLGHTQVVRNSASMFSFQSWATMTSPKPNFKGSCTKSS